MRAWRRHASNGRSASLPDGQVGQERVEERASVDVDPDAGVREVGDRSTPIGRREREKTDERRRIPTPMHDALEARTGARASLRDADELAAVDDELTRTDPAEAHES